MASSCPLTTSYTHSQPLMDCCQSRSYWLRWNDTTVEVGRGQVVGADSLLFQTTADVTFTVRFLYVYGYAGVPLDVTFG